MAQPQQALRAALAHLQAWGLAADLTPETLRRAKFDQIPPEVSLPRCSPLSLCPLLGCHCPAALRCHSSLAVTALCSLTSTSGAVGRSSRPAAAVAPRLPSRDLTAIDGLAAAAGSTVGAPAATALQLPSGHRSAVHATRKASHAGVVVGSSAFCEIAPDYAESARVSLECAAGLFRQTAHPSCCRAA